MANANVISEDDLSELFTKLWEIDENCCIPGEDFEINLQASLRYSDGDKDRSPESLFLWLDEEKVFSKPTYKAFAALLDNYELTVGVQETVTPEERGENAAFLAACLRTRPMREAHAFLAERGLASREPGRFAAELDRLWFGMYKRVRGGRRNLQDSSAFEHVFVGEARQDDEVMGAHNWLQLYLLERAHRLNYFGYYRRGTAPTDADGSPGIVALKFSLDDGPAKPRGGGFVGVSPEFEFALYTVAFLCHGGRVPLRVTVGPHLLNIYCHSIGDRMSTCYPELVT